MADASTTPSRSIREPATSSSPFGPAAETGGATLFSSALAQTGTFTFDTNPQANQISDAAVVSDPVSGNWLLTWRDGVGGGNTMVVDGTGKTVAPGEPSMASSTGSACAAVARR